MQYGENLPRKAGSEGATQAIHPDRCVHEFFEGQAAKTPLGIAVTSGNRCVTYRELDEMADAVASRLRWLGIGPDVIVAICTERSVEMMAGVLGILKAGGAYLPLDPGHPRERLLFMLEDSGAGMVLTECKFREKLFAGRPRIVCLDGGWAKTENPASPGPPGISTTALHLAYVIYTSGSTGKPKGVAMPHGPLANLLEWHRAQLPGARRTLQFASLSFDVSFQEIFSTWASGGTVVLVSEETRRDPAQLWSLVVREGVERLFLPCVALQQFAAAATDLKAPALRDIITAGEQLRITPAITAFFENNRGCVLHNHYGPSETHVVTSFSLAGPPGEWPPLPPIGKPIANTVVRILDTDMRPLAPGETGEIYISGSCLARGYLNRPGLSAERFVERDGVRMYKTGDMGHILPSGDIIFMGRSDDQVKIRGHRVEPGEVEAELLRHPGVSQCAVVATPEADGPRRLVSYIVPKQEMAEIFSDNLNEFLRKRLPDYMIPSVFARLDALPLTATGKMDRRALPLPGQEGFRAMRRSSAETNEAPKAASNSVEAELIGIWERILDLQPIGTRENFFELGGHSLLAMRLSGEVERKLGKRISPTTIFRAATVEELAAVLDEGADADEDSVIEKIRVTGSNTPFFCVPGLLDLARHLGPEQPCYGLQMPELGDDPDSWPTVEEIAAGCIQTIRATQPEGPYCIGGYSFGGVVAFEIARQLETAGETVSLLAMLEPDPPRPFRTTGVAFNVSRAIFHARRIADFTFRKQLGYLLDRIQKRRSRLSASLGDADDSDAELAAYMLRTETIHTRYHAGKFGGKTVMFFAKDTLWRVRPEKDPRLGWEDFTADDLEIHELPGDHTTVIREPGVRALAEQLRTHLEKTRRMDAGEPGLAGVLR